MAVVNVGDVTMNGELVINVIQIKNGSLTAVLVQGTEVHKLALLVETMLSGVPKYMRLGVSREMMKEPGLNFPCRWGLFSTVYSCPLMITVVKSL